MNLVDALEAWPYADPRELVRFAEKVRKTNTCWEWTAHKNKGGYGTLEVRRGDKWTPRMTHQLSYEWSRGKPAPKRHSGFCLDHKPRCRNRACVRPTHIRRVRNRVNSIDNSVSPMAQNSRKTHCPQGHEYLPENTYVTPEGFRQCRICQRERSAKWKRKVGYTQAGKRRR